MLHTSFVEIGPLVLEKWTFEGGHLWSYGIDVGSKLSFPLPMEALRKVWICIDWPSGFREEDVLTLLHVKHGEPKFMVRLS